MSVEETSVVDMIGVGNDGHVHLRVSDHLLWDGEHLFTLQEKLNAYLRFIESGEVYEAFPSAKGRGFVVEIAALHVPSKEAEHFFGHVRDSLQKGGIGFEVRGEGDADAS